VSENDRLPNAAPSIVGQAGTFRPMLRLALPVLGEQLLGTAVWFSDRLLTGHYLDTAHLAAVTLMAYVLWLTWGVSSVVATGATAMVARFVGAGRQKNARWVANQAVLLGAVFAILVATGGWLLGPRVATSLQLQGVAAELATEYLLVVLPAVPMMMLMTVGIACLRGAGDMVAGLVVMAVVDSVNIAVSWALVLGLGPLPELGWRGIALGTAVAYTTGGLLVLGMLLRGRSGLRLSLRRLIPRMNLIRRLLRIGIPGGADMLSIIGCQLWFLALINQLGNLATAAHGVAICVESIMFMPGAAFQMAAATIAGQYLGARDPARATRGVLMALATGGSVMLVAAISIFTFAAPLAGLFVAADQADVARQAAPLLRTVSLAMPALALTIILTGGLRGSGDTRWPLAISLLGLLGVRIPLTHYLAFDAFHLPLLGWTVDGLDLGVAGAWYAMAADLYVRAALITTRFLSGGWRRIEV